MSNDEAITALKELQQKDKSFAYDYSESEGLIEYENGTGKIDRPGQSSNGRESAMSKVDSDITYGDDLYFWKKSNPKDKGFGVKIPEGDGQEDFSSKNFNLYKAAEEKK